MSASDVAAHLPTNGQMVEELGICNFYSIIGEPGSRSRDVDPDSRVCQ